MMKGFRFQVPKALVGSEGVREDGGPLFMEMLKASRIVPLMVQGLAKREVMVT